METIRNKILDSTDIKVTLCNVAYLCYRILCLTNHNVKFPTHQEKQTEG